MPPLLVRWVLCATGLLLAACSTGPRLIEKDAQSDEIRKATTLSATLPAGCPTLRATIPAGNKDVTVSYDEPTTIESGIPLTDLAYTTVYLSTSDGRVQSIKILTVNPRGGAHVKLTHVVTPAGEFGLCATATNRYSKESSPTPITTER